MSLAHKIDSIVAGAIERQVFPGAVVLVAVDGMVRHYTAYGSTMYDAPGSRPVKRDTIYDIASLTKVFTATAALRLIDLGRLDLHAPVTRYLAGFHAAAVTIFHLLTHTSGLDIRLSTHREGGRAGVLHAAYSVMPSHPPGTRVAYTNVNSLLLGEIVARLCGAPLDEAIRALILAPLGLGDTFFRPLPALLARIAPTELDESWRGGLVHGNVHDESAHALGGVAGHAGLFSSAADLFAFCSIWLDMTESHAPRTESRVAWRETDDPRSSIRDSRSSHCRILRPETMRLACTNHTRALQLGCGLGWMIDRPNFMGAAPAGSFGHTGFTGPAIVVIPQQRLIVVVLSNRVYPRRGPPEHHAVTAAIVQAALAG